MSRARLLRGSVGIAAAAAGGAGAAALAGARTEGSLSHRDREVLEFALTLEHLQVAFYSEALHAGNLTGEVHQFAKLVSAEEREHLEYVRKALGGGAGAAGKYDFGPATSDNRHFVATAVKLEEIGLAAYNGQAGNVSKPTLRSLARVMSVEARHVAWIRVLAGKVPAPTPTDTPISAQAATRALRAFQ